jgi:hypothetical protein
MSGRTIRWSGIAPASSLPELRPNDAYQVGKQIRGILMGSKHQTGQMGVGLSKSAD